MPTAMPTCRNVSLIPAAMPLCSLGTTDSATSAITGLSRPDAGAGQRGTRRSRAVHSSVGSMPPISSRPHAGQAEPARTGAPAPARVPSSAPPAAETKKVITVSGR